MKRRILALVMASILLWGSIGIPMSARAEDGTAPTKTAAETMETTSATTEATEATAAQTEEMTEESTVSTTEETTEETTEGTMEETTEVATEETTEETTEGTTEDDTEDATEGDLATGKPSIKWGYIAIGIAAVVVLVGLLFLILVLRQKKQAK